MLPVSTINNDVNHRYWTMMPNLKWHLLDRLLITDENICLLQCILRGRVLHWDWPGEQAAEHRGEAAGPDPQPRHQPLGHQVRTRRGQQQTIWGSLFWYRYRSQIFLSKNDPPPPVPGSCSTCRNFKQNRSSNGFKFNKIKLNWCILTCFNVLMTYSCYCTYVHMNSLMRNHWTLSLIMICHICDKKLHLPANCQLKLFTLYI